MRCARCAVELFEKSAPGCFGVIYMDIMMPRMNGWDAARTIRAMNRPDAEIIPIIAMSANAFSEDIMDSRLAGMDIHLAKPLDEAKMINALKQCIAERSAVKPVSYTHLDVYKRQAPACSRICLAAAMLSALPSRVSVLIPITSPPCS